jgi:glyoxylase I family protein
VPKLSSVRHAHGKRRVAVQTPTEGNPYPHLYHAGICRIALVADNLQEVCDTVKAAKMAGVEFFSEPQVMKNRDGTNSSFVCFTDPDGTVIELIQFR